MRCTIVNSQPYEPESNVSNNLGNKKEPTLQDIQEHFMGYFTELQASSGAPLIFFLNVAQTGPIRQPVSLSAGTHSREDGLSMMPQQPLLLQKRRGNNSSLRATNRDTTQKHVLMLFVRHCWKEK